MAQLSKRWLSYFLDIAKLNASMSKDERTHVGAVIADEEEKVVISSGWNDLPRGVAHTGFRNTAPLKYKLTSHAEISAIANAARMGRATLGKTIIVTMYPCSLCTAAIINAGIKKVYTIKPDFNHAKYGQDFMLSQMMFIESEIEVIEIEE